MSCDIGEMTERLEIELCYDYNYELCSFSNLSVTSPTPQLILQAFRRFTYVTAHSPLLSLLHLRHSSFYNPSFASPTSQVLHLSNLANRPCFTVGINVKIAQNKILHSFGHVHIYVTTHSSTFPSLYIRHSSFSNPSVASPTSQLILHPYFRFSYVTGFSLTSPGEPPISKFHELVPFVENKNPHRLHTRFNKLTVNHTFKIPPDTQYYFGAEPII